MTIRLDILNTPAKPEEKVVNKGRGHQQAVEAVQDTAMPGDQAPGVLYSGLPLQGRLQEITGCGTQGNQRSEEGRAPRVQSGQSPGQEAGRRSGGKGSPDQAGQKTLHRFVGADPGGQLMPPPAHADAIGQGIVCPDPRQESVG